MKIKLLVFCLLLPLPALAQFGSLTGPSMASSYQVTNHPARAMQMPAPDEQSLLGANAITMGHGEMPLWEAIKEVRATPLGDQARALKKEHETAKEKSKVVWVN